MKVCYIVHPSFFELLSKYPQLLHHVDDFSKDQRAFMFEKLEVENIMYSASSYFQRGVVLDECTLLLEDVMKKNAYSIEIHDDFIILDNEENPFLPFLKRKFRGFLMCDRELR